MAKAKKTKKETPLMQQYDRIKTEHPDALLLFRVGDFYETFGPDAVTASRVLGIVLTKRANGAASHIALAGFPHHSLDTYLPKLVRAGHRVAICDQLEDPKLTKNIVKRGVTEVVTPGVALSDQVVDQRSNNFLGSISIGASNYGIAFLDVTTGEFMVGEGDQEQVEKFLAGYVPSELLYPKDHGDRFVSSLTGRQADFGLEDWVFTEEFATETLLRHFGTASLKGFGIEGLGLGQQAAAAILHYLARTHHDRIGHVDRIQRLQAGKYVWLDRFTVRNLELIAPVNEGATTLLDTLDDCTTPMGSRLLRRWVLFPLLELEAIEERHAVVEALKDQIDLAEKVSAELNDIGDLERLGGKAATGRINPREVLQLSNSLRASQRLKGLMGAEPLEALVTMADRIAVPMDMVERIESSIEPEAPVSINKGGVIRQGLNTDLDELRDTSANAKDLLLQLQQREVERTGITSLKVGFNNVFGYYLEVKNTHKSKVPAEWVRKQTLVNAERYITDELKGLEERILHADEHIQVLETRLFNELIDVVCNEVAPIRSTGLCDSQLGYPCHVRAQCH